MWVKLYLLCVICIYMSESRIGIYMSEIKNITNIKMVDYCRENFENCICTDTYVECHNEKKLNGDITKLFHYIKDHVVEITITGSNLQQLPQNVFGSCKDDKSLVLYQLKTVDLSNNNISTIHWKSFRCFPNLKTLNLSNNIWEYHRAPNLSGYFSSVPKLKLLDLTNAFKEIQGGNLHITKLEGIFSKTELTSLKTLKLCHNELYSTSLSSANWFCQLTSLETLDVSHNNFKDPYIPRRTPCLENLETLDFSFNRMTILPHEFMNKLERLQNLRVVKLNNNPFFCDCGLIKTWMWLNSTKVPVQNRTDLKCAGGYRFWYRNKPILSLSLSDLRCGVLDTNTAVKTVPGVIFHVFAVVGLRYM